MATRKAAPAATTQASTGTASTSTTAITIKPPNIQYAAFRLEGTSPFVQLRFSEKAMNAMAAKMKEGSTARSKKIREARDFDQDLKDALHVSTEGWIGIPAGAFRNAMISACKLVGFAMTKAKLSIFVDADGFDCVDGVPLVKLDAGKPESTRMAVRNQTGVADLRVRPMWREWGVDLRVSFDGDQFTVADVTNLLARAGMQVGVGEGRHDSRTSAGLGWGCFRVSETR